MRQAGKKRESRPSKATGSSPVILRRGSPLSGVLPLPLAVLILSGKELLELFHLLRIENLANLLLGCLPNGPIASIDLLVELIETLTAFPKNLVEFSSL